MMKLSWLISLAISFFGFIIVGELFGVTPKDATGNLGFIGLIFLLPFLLLSLFTTFRFFYTLSQRSDRLGKGIGIVCSLLFLGFFLYFSLDIKNEFTQSFGESIFHLDGQTSKLYFNFYVFGLIHTVSALIGWIPGMFLPVKSPPTNHDESPVE
jgi:glucan phosphoethanolaminetransferase (alkaline phosphatase superfamily)